MATRRLSGANPHIAAAVCLPWPACSLQRWWRFGGSRVQERWQCASSLVRRRATNTAPNLLHSLRMWKSCVCRYLGAVLLAARSAIAELCAERLS